MESINDNYWTMRAEAVPEDEKSVPEGDRVIFLCHVSVNEGKHVSFSSIRLPAPARRWTDCVGADRHSRPHELSAVQWQVTMFGDPICMRVGAEERMEQLAKRVQERLGVADDEFAKWKFCHVKGIASSSAEWLAADDIVAEKFTRQSGLHSGADQPYLGLHHTVTHSKRQTRSTNVYERAIKIYS